jgi:light-regulated signal transduction histidine kinase (bacteriophytochrome)
VSAGRDPNVAELSRDRRLELANEELRRANRELDQFAYVASHDLREPLRMINIYTQLLIERYGSAFDDTGRQFAQHVQDNVTRMEQLIHDVLEYSRTVHPNEYPLVPVALRKPLEQALAMFRDQLAAVGGRIETSELPAVLADEKQLVLLFQNLLSNSLKYADSERRPCIRIWARHHRDRWAIHFADNGIGFEPEFAERIFGLFKRLHGREISGTGLGLAICRRIIEAHGGTIWAEGKAKKGATFIFTLKAWNRYGSSLTNFAGGGQCR